MAFDPDFKAWSGC